MGCPNIWSNADVALLTPALCRRARAVCGRTEPKIPRFLWRARMLKLQSAGAVSTNALLALIYAIKMHHIVTTNHLGNSKI
jgi:hypothetical protein